MSLTLAELGRVGSRRKPGRNPDSRHPSPHDGKQIRQIYGLSHIIGSPGLQAFFTIAFHGFGRQCDDRQRADTRKLANGPGGLVAIHLRHHDVHEHEFRVRVLLQDFNAASAGFRVNHANVMVLQSAGQSENIAEIIVDDQYLPARQVRIDVADICQYALLARTQAVLHSMQKDDRLIQQTLPATAHIVRC